MRFDDTLETILAADAATPAAAQAAWRQIVDLIGRQRVPADGRAMQTLQRIRSDVPLAVRAASARALFGARPPLGLVRLFALDDIAVGAPLLRGAELSARDWIALLPELSPTARAVLRHRRDLPAEVTRALASFGPVDFVLAGEPAPEPVALPETADEPIVTLPQSAEPGAFVALGKIALGLPLVAEALRRENDNEQPVEADDGFRIADVVARIEAYRREQEAAPPSPAPRVGPAPGRFRFETDASGVLRWIDGAARGSLIGLSLAQSARPGGAGVDGVAAGAFRRRAPFTSGRLNIAAGSDVAGTWLIAGVPAFDPASGRFTGYRGSARRPRAHERPERRHVPSQAADSLRQLVHELRTPTNAITGFSEMIEQQMLGPVAAPYRAQAATIRGDAGGLLAAIDDLDAAARIENGALELRPERVELMPLLAGIAQELSGLARQRDATLALPDGSAAVQADARSVERLIARLIGTMVGAAGRGETIAVRLSDPLAADVALTVSRPAAFAAYAGEALLAIDDEASEASLLGTGFALRLVRNLARELDGRLTIADDALTLYLPPAVDRAMEQARQG